MFHPKARSNLSGCISGRINRCPCFFLTPQPIREKSYSLKTSLELNEAVLCNKGCHRDSKGKSDGIKILVLTASPCNND
jgi:hypothetical protein